VVYRSLGTQTWTRCDRLMGRIHGAIVAATGWSDRRGDGDNRPLYTLQVIVAATIACSVYRGRLRRSSPRRSLNPTVVATIAPCIHPITIGTRRRTLIQCSIGSEGKAVQVHPNWLAKYHIDPPSTCSKPRPLHSRASWQNVRACSQ